MRTTYITMTMEDLGSLPPYLVDNDGTHPLDAEAARHHQPVVAALEARVAPLARSERVQLACSDKDVVNDSARDVLLSLPSIVHAWYTPGLRSARRLANCFPSAPTKKASQAFKTLSVVEWLPLSVSNLSNRIRKTMLKSPKTWTRWTPVKTFGMASATASISPSWSALACAPAAGYVRDDVPDSE